MTSLTPRALHRPRRQTPEWLILFYGFLAMILVTAAYRFVSYRAYAVARRASRKAKRYSQQVMDAAVPPQAELALAPARVRAKSRA